MSCCGQRRAQQRTTPSAFVHELAVPRASAGRFSMGTTYFEYLGQTGITAVGRATGQQYRFTTPGVPVLVDARDRRSLAQVPNLREVR